MSENIIDTEQEEHEYKYREGFIYTCFGVMALPETSGIDFTTKFKIKEYRLGQFLNCFYKLVVRTSSNILAKDLEYFEPCSLGDLQQLVGIKDRSFKVFLKELTELEIINVKNKIIYVNPLLMMAYDMELIGENLIELFPRYENNFNKINEALSGGISSINEEGR